MRVQPQTNKPQKVSCQDATCSANQLQSNISPSVVSALQKKAAGGATENIQHNLFIIEQIFPRCSSCSKRAILEEVREVSGAQIFWGCILMCTIPLLCWLPFCFKRCDDRRLECSNCHEVRDYYQSPMCPFCCWHHHQVW